MRGVRSLVAVIFAVLAICLISVPAFSGEHPWDSDGSQSGNSGGSGLPSDSTKGTAVVSSSSCSHGGEQSSFTTSRGSAMSLVYRVSYYFAERVFEMRYGAGASVGTMARRSGR